MNVIDVEGIGPTYAGQLEAIGVKTTDDLLERGATPKGPKSWRRHPASATL